MSEILLKIFDSLSEAKLAKNLLEKYGIKSIIQRGPLVAIGEIGDIGRTDLFVLEKDIEKAKEILKTDK